MKKEGLTSTQLRAISCILESNSIEEAAKKAKVSRGSIYIWLKDVNFRERLHQERDALFSESLELLKQATGKAVKELINLLNSRDETTRRLAAREILSQSLKITEIRDLEERITKVEQVVEREHYHQ